LLFPASFQGPGAGDNGDFGGDNGRIFHKISVREPGRGVETDQFHTEGRQGIAIGGMLVVELLQTERRPGLDRESLGRIRTGIAHNGMLDDRRRPLR
jgi:hypothetical protein